MRWNVWPASLVGADMRFSLRDEMTNLGSMLIRMRACTDEHIQRALAIQKDKGSSMPLGQILCALGLAKLEDVEKALELQQRMRDGEAVQVAEELDRESLSRCTVTADPAARQPQ